MHVDAGKSQVGVLGPLWMVRWFTALHGSLRRLGEWIAHRVHTALLKATGLPQLYGRDH